MALTTISWHVTVKNPLKRPDPFDACKVGTDLNLFNFARFVAVEIEK